MSRRKPDLQSTSPKRFFSSGKPTATVEHGDNPLTALCASNPVIADLGDRCLLLSLYGVFLVLFALMGAEFVRLEKGGIYHRPVFWGFVDSIALASVLAGVTMAIEAEGHERSVRYYFLSGIFLPMVPARGIDLSRKSQCLRPFARAPQSKPEDWPCGSLFLQKQLATAARVASYVQLVWDHSTAGGRQRVLSFDNSTKIPRSRSSVHWCPGAWNHATNVDGPAERTPLVHYGGRFLVAALSHWRVSVSKIFLSIATASMFGTLAHLHGAGSEGDWFPSVRL